MLDCPWVVIIVAGQNETFLALATICFLRKSISRNCTYP